MSGWIKNSIFFLFYSVQNLSEIDFFTGIVTVILIRTLRRDIAKYNAEDDMVNYEMCIFD